MSTDGQSAEQLAADYLQTQGFEIIGRNYKTYWYELDIVAVYDQVVHVVEVKYRRSARYGSALEYVSPAKARQLRFAARAWAQESGWSHDYMIDVIGITGALCPDNLVHVENAVESDFPAA